MTKLSISDLATILQLDSQVKEKLAKNFEDYSENLQETILKILWDGVLELQKRLAKLKYEGFLQEIKEGKRKLTTDLYSEAVETVWKDFDELTSGKKDDIRLIESIRAQLKPLIQSTMDSSPAPSTLKPSGQALQKP